MAVGADMWRDVRLPLLLLLFAATECNSTSPPGKPVLLDCRSPEKETFTCWWEPGFSGDPPATHRLYYEREKLEGTHECPDYHSAGENSCFFDKNHTSIWVDYYLTVVAFNALGNATSDVLKIDVMEIVKPTAPENVTLLVEHREDSRSLHVTWEHPHNIDTKSGWVTLEYQLRVMQKDTGSKWKEYKSGTQTQFTLYSVNPGAEYMVQVCCRLDHGSWSEWTNTTSIKIPVITLDHQREKHFWILVSTLSAIPFLAAMCVFFNKKKSVKQCLLPPVPGPKIRGIDVQLLKSGRSEDVISALIINHSFPPVVAWKDQLEDYLIVSDSDELHRPESQKRRKSLIISAGFHLDFEIQCKDSTSSQNDGEKGSKRKDELDNFAQTAKSPPREGSSNLDHLQQPTQKPHCPGVSTGAAHRSRSDHDGTEAVANGGYVDVHAHGEAIRELDYSRGKEANAGHFLMLGEGNCCSYMDAQRRENVPEDYSRVREVSGDNMVFLQKRSDVSCGEAGERYSHTANQKPRDRHVTGPGKAEVCTELADGGYVEAVPAPPLI